MYLDSTSIILLSIALLIIIALVTMEIVSAKSKYADQKSKYTTLRKHYGKLYNTIHDENKKTHKYYPLQLQYLNQDYDDGFSYNEWYLTEKDMIEAINKHNKIAYQVREKLDKLGLDHSNKHMFDRHGEAWKKSLDQSKEEQHAIHDKSQDERANWYKQTDIIAEELSLKVGSYGYNDLPYPINIEDLKNTSGDWYNTRTVEISKEGVQELLNKVAYN